MYPTNFTMTSISFLASHAILYFLGYAFPPYFSSPYSYFIPCSVINYGWHASMSHVTQGRRGQPMLIGSITKRHGSARAQTRTCKSYFTSLRHIAGVLQLHEYRGWRKTKNMCNVLDMCARTCVHNANLHGLLYGQTIIKTLIECFFQPLRFKTQEVSPRAVGVTQGWSLRLWWVRKYVNGRVSTSYLHLFAHFQAGRKRARTDCSSSLTKPGR